MKHSLLLLSIFLAPLIFPRPLWAEPPPAPTKEVQQRLPQQYPLVTLYGGLAAGGTFLRNDPLLTASTHTGSLFGAGSCLDLAWPLLTFSLGLTWHSSDIAITAADSSLPNPPLSIATSFGDIALTSRLHLPAALEIGPSLRLAFGSDTSFGLEEGDTSTALFAGAELLRTFPSETDTSWQLGLRAYKAVSLAERDVYLAEAFVNVGLGLNKAKIRTLKTTTHVLEEVKKVTEYRDHYFVSVGVIYFTTGKADLPSYTQEYLGDIGDYLQKNPEAWQFFHITSHADIRGSAELNEQLSTQRGQAIMDLLTSKGIPTDKLAFKSLSASDPVEATMAEVSLARNRRVEIAISGDKNVKPLEEQLELLKQRFRRIQAKCRLRSCE